MTLVDDIIAALGVAGYTFEKGNPFDGTPESLVKSNVEFEYMPTKQGQKRWALTYNYYCDDVDEGEGLADVLAGLGSMAKPTTYQNGFETDAQVAGFTRTGTATVERSSTKKHGGTCSMKISGNDLEQTQVKRASTGPITTFEAWVLLVGTPAGIGLRVGVENGSGDWCCYFYPAFVASWYWYTYATGGDSTPVEVVADTWYKLGAVINNDTNKVDFYINDELVRAGKTLENEQGSHGVAAFHYANNANQTWHVDDVAVDGLELLGICVAGVPRLISKKKVPGDEWKHWFVAKQEASEK